MNERESDAARTASGTTGLSGGGTGHNGDRRAQPAGGRIGAAPRDSDTRYRALAELSPDVILVVAGGRFVYANEAAAKIFGAESPQGVLGRTPFNFIESEDYEFVRRRIRAVVVERRILPQVEMEWRRLDGSHVPVEVITGPLDWQGTPAIQVVARDITLRRRAEAARASEERRYRTLFDSIDEGFCIVEMLFDGAGKPVDYRFLEVNPAFKKQTGIDNAVGRRMREFAPTHEQHWLEICGRVALTGESVRFESPAEELGRFYDVYAFRVGRPEQRRVAILFNDIAERKQLEERLRRAATKLAEAGRRKDEYLAMLGHELRNPLAAIRNATELMKLVPVEDARLRRACGVLERQSSHMARLVDGLLEVSRIARGKVHLTPERIDVREVLEPVLQDHSAEIAARGLELDSASPSEPLWILGDSIRLAQVFDNVIGNAIKFSGRRGTIAVTLAREAGCAVVRVRDSGVGIRPEILPRIFEAFQQDTQDPARSAGGLGLGLALARGLVELHRGTIEARSDGPGSGAEFVIRLPLISAPAAARPTTRAPDASPQRILIVEDNHDAAESLRELLELRGHSVTVADSGPGALAALRSCGVDIVLCDLGLPGMSGYELAHAIRTDPGLRGISLVALTGYGQPEDRARTAQAGFDAHLTKPIDLAALDETFAAHQRAAR